MTLKLEYKCTEAELKEAQALNLRRQHSRGSRWVAQVLNAGFISLSAVVLFFRFKTEVTPKERPWLIASMLVIISVVLFFTWRFRKKTDGIVQAEISDQGLVFTNNGRVTLAWSAFSGCLESPGLFVLVNRSKSILYAVPKRAFPDESSQNWFRTLASQPSNTGAAAGDMISPGRFTAKGITVTVQMGFPEYLTRLATTWRMKGCALGILALVIGLGLFMPDPPNAVISREKALVYMVAMMIPILAGVLLLIAVMSWWSERKWRKPQHLALSSEGIEFASDGATGNLPWSTYQYYLENRWAFFVWHPQGALWFMLPKRQFSAGSDIEHCRDLLRTNLQASRWFYL